MKAPWIVLSAVLAAFGLCAGLEWREENARAGALAQQVAQLKAAVAAANEKMQSLEAESEQLRAARAMAGARLEPAAAPAPAPAGQGNSLARMLKDPALHKMLLAQQDSALRGFYADYVRQANLTPDEADKFFRILRDRQMALMDSSEAMISGGAVDMKAAQAANNTADEALEDLLGVQRFGQYRDFEKTLGARMEVQMFSARLGADEPLNESQSQALIRIVSEERAAMPAIDSVDMDEASRQIDAMNQRVYDRAKSVLTPEQLALFATFQKNTADAQRAGLRMTQPPAAQ